MEGVGRICYVLIHILLLIAVFHSIFPLVNNFPKKYRKMPPRESSMFCSLCCSQGRTFESFFLVDFIMLLLLLLLELHVEYKYNFQCPFTSPFHLLTHSLSQSPSLSIISSVFFLYYFFMLMTKAHKFKPYV